LISIYHQIANGYFGNSCLLPTLQMDANQNADQFVTSRGHPGPRFSLSLYHYQAKTTELLGDVVCSANWLLYSWLGT
jgi:hypothetical protein